jgi:hypothetical protein
VLWTSTLSACRVEIRRISISAPAMLERNIAGGTQDCRVFAAINGTA